MALTLDPIYLANLILSITIVIIGIALYRLNKNEVALYIAIAFSLFAFSHFAFLIGLRDLMDQYLFVIRIIAYVVIVYGLYRSWRQVKTQITELSKKNEQLKKEISERERAEQKIMHLNSVLLSISEINQLIVKEKDPEILLNEVCNILFKTRNYRHIWIGKAEKNEFKVIPVASAGLNKDYIKSINVTLDDSATGQGSTGKAIKTGKPQINFHKENIDSYEYYKKDVMEPCNTTAIDLPIYSGNKIYGVLNICSEYKGSLDDNEFTLLCKLAEDIGIALYNIKIETDQKIAEEKIKESLKEKEILLREIHHRVKNNMQIVSSLLSLQSRYIDDKKTFELFRDSQNRVMSMALVHEKLYQSESISEIDLSEYIKSLINDLYRSYGVNNSFISFDVNVDDISLDINTAIPCGLIINELVTNSIKHAFPIKGQETLTSFEDEKWKITIDIHSIGENKYKLTVSDNGIGFPDDLDFKNTKSLGLRLVVTLTEQLHGSIKLDKTDGTKFEIIFNPS